MTARDKFIAYCEAQLDKPALWGAKGDDAFDCSGLVTCAIRFAGGPDMRHTHNANSLAKETRRLQPDEKPVPGDLIFFDADQNGVNEHVGVVRNDTTSIDASGATSSATSLEQALALNARVRLHPGHAYRKGARIHRNTYLDSIEWVTR